MKCLKCQHQNDAGDHFCGNCGKPLIRRVEKKRRVPSWAIVLTMLCLLTLGGVGYFFFLPDDRIDTTDVAKENEPAELEKPVEDEPEDVDEPEKTTEEKVNVALNEPLDKETGKELEKAEPVQPTKNEPLDKVALIQQVTTKVYTINTPDNQGTGFLYKAGGYIVTNAHVVKGFVDVTLTNYAGEDVQGTVIGISDEFDIALVKADAYASTEPLLLETDESPVGLEIIAFGSPHGFANTATMGYITGTGRELEADFLYKQLYQIDAQIDVGSSGGPLVDSKTGKVIGINSLVLTENNDIGFAIPLYTMTPTIEQWIKSPLNADQVLDIGNNNQYGDVFEGNEEELFNLNIGQIDIIENYVALFIEYKHIATTKGEYYWIADMIDPESPLYQKLETEVAEQFAEGKSSEYIEHEILDITYDDETSKYFVVAKEVFDEFDKEGNIQTIEQTLTYTVRFAENDTVYIEDIQE